MVCEQCVEISSCFPANEFRVVVVVRDVILQPLTDICPLPYPCPAAEDSYWNWEFTRSTLTIGEESNGLWASTSTRCNIGAAALAVGVVMKLIHHHVVHVGIRAVAERHVRENFRRAAEDGRVAIDRRIAGAEADVVGAELAAERHPLFIHQRLDRAGVDGAPPFRERLEVQRRGHERFA